MFQNACYTLFGSHQRVFRFCCALVSQINFDECSDFQFGFPTRFVKRFCFLSILFSSQKNFIPVVVLSLAFRNYKLNWERSWLFLECGTISISWISQFSSKLFDISLAHYCFRAHIYKQTQFILCTLKWTFIVVFIFSSLLFGSMHLRYWWRYE